MTVSNRNRRGPWVVRERLLQRLSGEADGSCDTVWSGEWGDPPGGPSPAGSTHGSTPGVGGSGQSSGSGPRPDRSQRFLVRHGATGSDVFQALVHQALEMKLFQKLVPGGILGLLTDQDELMALDWRHANLPAVFGRGPATTTSGGYMMPGIRAVRWLRLADRPPAAEGPLGASFRNPSPSWWTAVSLYPRHRSGSRGDVAVHRGRRVRLHGAIRQDERRRVPFVVSLSNHDGVGTTSFGRLRSCLRNPGASRLLTEKGLHGRAAWLPRAVSWRFSR